MLHTGTEDVNTAAYSPGLEGVLAGESAICQVDEGEAGLRYRGYAITDLAEQATFEETAFLLLFGRLPASSELLDFTRRLEEAAHLDDGLRRALELLPRHAHPMDWLRTAVSWLGTLDADASDSSHDANIRKAIRLLACMPLIVAAGGTGMRSAEEPSGERRAYAERLLRLLTGRHPDTRTSAMARVLDISLILYAEHEFNASTFAARVTASTMSDMYAAVTSAIGTLKGPLHGGANEAVAAMLSEVGSPMEAERWVRDQLAGKRRVMGFGHRVLKKGDSRSLIIQREARQLSEICGDLRWYRIAATIDHVMQEEKGLFPNLDFYTAVAYLLMGIPRRLYTPVFVCSRMAGWCAHVIEQQDHNRLIRPRALYTGPQPRDYVPIDRRG